MAHGFDLNTMTASKTEPSPDPDRVWSGKLLTSDGKEGDFVFETPEFMTRRTYSFTGDWFEFREKYLEDVICFFLDLLGKTEADERV